MSAGLRRTCALLLVITPGLASSVPAQAPLEPYRIDLARHFFASPDAQRTAVARIDATLARMGSLRGRVGQSASSLERALMLSDSLRAELLLHSAYFTVRTLTDTRDGSSARRLQALSAKVAMESRFIGDEIVAVPEAVLQRFYGERRTLRRYQFAISELRRPGGPKLTTSQAGLVQELAPLAEQWPAELYNRMFGRRSDPERDEDLFAFALIGRARAGSTVARLKWGQPAPAVAYADRYLSARDVTAVTAALADRAELHKRFERSRIAALRKQLGRDSVRYYTDYLAPPESDLVPRFTMDSARAAIQSALLPLGDEYQREVAALLDPRNGRLDVAGGSNRAPGAVTPATAAQAGASVVYAAAFDGSLIDVLTLAHEGAHAVHFELMRHAGVPPVYSSGPEYLAESVAYFNEFLVADHLARVETSPGMRRHLLEQSLERRLQVFTQARDVLFEDGVYAGTADGSLNGAADLNRLFDRIGARFSVWHGMDPDVQRHWIRIPHYYRSPFYRVNYLYARLLAIRYFDMYRADPAAFVPRFLAMLRSGYSDRAPDLLQAHLGIRMDGAALAASAVRMLEADVATLDAQRAP